MRHKNDALLFYLIFYFTNQIVNYIFREITNIIALSKGIYSLKKY